MHGRSVMTIGIGAFKSCSNLKVVVIVPTAISIGTNESFGDSALTRLDVTQDICVQVLDSCSGTCTQFLQCFSSLSSAHSQSPSLAPAPTSTTIAPPPPSPPSTHRASTNSSTTWAIVSIVIFAIMVVLVMVALLLRKYPWSHCIRCIDYSEVRAMEMPPSIPEQSTDDDDDNNSSGTIEARALPQGELLVSPGHASPYPAATAVVVRSVQQAVVVSGHEIVITPTTIEVV